MHRGILSKWDANKGFGFIKSPDLPKDTFIHISTLKHMSRAPKQGDFIHFEIDQNQGKIRAINARIEGVKANQPIKKVKRSKGRPNNKLLYLVFIVGVLVFIFQRLTPAPTPTVNKTLDSINHSVNNGKNIQQFTCDGRQYCTQMTSRAEAEYFVKYCPDTKMDGDNDGIPCENDSRF